ncbi:MAG: DUF11 domain-containing protein [Caldilineaceae bacterium]|nr:DUF11 domain-containing protein [Caldilineaceae bacterium]
MQKTYQPSLRLLMITLGILATFMLSVRVWSSPGEAAANQGATASEAQVANQPNEPIGEAVIGDLVWLDTSLNGLEAPGEPGIAGVFLRLWQDDNDFIFDPAKDTYLSTTVTADGSGVKPAGYYQFNVSRSQTYWVEVMDSNFSPGGPLHNFMLTSGPTKGDEPMIVPFVDADGTDTIDFGYAPTGVTLIKRAGSAPNGGVHYIPQAGANVTFTYAYTNTGLTELINVQIKDDNGTPADATDDFLVCNVAKLIAGATGTCTAANRPISANHTNIATVVGTPTANFELGKEVTASDDAVVALFASVGDQVWNDANSNGIQETGELGVSGVTVELFNAAGQSQGITTTNTSGTYRFNNLIAGQYKVKFTLPNGFQFSSQDQLLDDTKDSDANTGTGETALFALQAGDVQLKWDAGIFNNAGIGDKVWEDLNANGIQDAGELGIDKVTVRLFSGAGVELGSTTTDGSGLYRFSNLVGGSYYLVFDAPGGYSFSPPNVGDDTKDSDFEPALGRTATFTLPAGQSDITRDAGLFRPASLGDRVWQDLNANGIQDSGEPNIPGVTVELYNSANVKIDTTTTNDSGIYSFTGLTPGQYDVKFVQPNGYRPTLQNQLSNDAVDSDASPSTGHTGLIITLISGQNDITWDAGFYMPGAINVVKTANPTTIVSGQLVTYTYVITNGGGLAIQNVTVTDDKCSPVSARISGDTDSDNQLDISESWLYRCSTTLTQTTTNTVTSAGTDLAANPVSATAKAVVTVVTPVINVVKTANPTVILANQNVAYTFVVTNPGNVPLSSVTVSDNKCASVVYQSGDTNTNNVLETSESWTYTCSQALSSTTTNIVTVSGQPATPAGVPLPGIGRVQDTDTVTVTVIAPGIDIVKSVAPATIYVNGTVTYTFRVSNTGNITLGSVAVADNKCSPLTRTGGDANSNNRLEVGEIWIYTCSSTLAQDTVNTATVTGQPVDGSGVPVPGVNPVSDQDTATVNVINPAIRIVKSASASVVNQGDPVTYTLDVSNIGDDSLTSVATTDNKCAPLSGPTPVAPANANNILEPGETWRYSCTTVLTQDTTNIASTQGTDSLGKPVTDTDEVFVDVISAGIQLEKSASAPLVYSGSMVTYTFQVSNTGTDPLSNVVVADDKCSPISARLSGDTNSDNKLDRNEIWLYSCAKSLAQTTVNVATATGQDALNNPQSDQSSATVRVISPAIKVTKAVNKTVIVSGTQVIYSYVVTNPGNDPLASVTVSDNKCAPLTSATPNPGDVANVGKLDPGEAWTYSCTTALTQTTLNTVTAAGVDSLGGSVQSTATANVTVVKPGISIVKSVNKSVVRPGTAVVYTYVVKNTGDVPLASLNLTDDKCTPLTRQSGDTNTNSVLETTETWTYTCQSTISQTTVNIAVATGQPSDPAGVPLPGINPVTAQDTATVRVITPGITVEKSATPTTIYSGNSVTYNYTVRNTGNSTLNTVTISDDKCNPVTYVSGDTNNNQQMEVTETWIYRCTTSLTVDTTNTVTVNAKDESGGNVTDTDTAVVNVINPGINVDKQTTVTAVASGTVVTYTYVVTNSGDDPLAGVKVTDDKCSPVTFVNGDTNSNSRLDLTEVWNYTCATVLTASTTNIATATGNDSLGNPVNDTDTVTVQVFGLATIGNLVWLDKNANGIQDTGEAGLAGVLVTLYRNNSVVMTQTTPANGSYLFNNLTPGDYSVGVTLPAGHRFSPQNQGGDPAKDSDVNINTGRAVVTTLTSGETDLTWDAGLYMPASLGDRVWEDLNGNGIQDAGEPGLGGVTVLLLNGSGGLVTSATTQPDGSYLFNNLTPGTYQVQFTALQSYLFTLRNSGLDTGTDSNANPTDGKSEPVTLVSGEENRTIDAGLYRPARLGDRVWLDTNQDGIQNNNEAGHNGLVVTLFKGDGTQVMTQTTSGGGSYLFTNLTPGSYFVHFQSLANYLFTTQYAGTNSAADSNADRNTGRTETVGLSSGDANLTLDAGFVVAAPRIQSIKTSQLAVDDDSNGVVSPGDTLAYRIVISNIGTAPATNIGFNDSLDPNTSLVVGSVSTNRGTVILGNSTGNTSVQVAVGTLLPTESVTIDLRVRIHNPLPAGVTQIVNQGVVSSVELPDEPTDDDGLGGGTGDPTVAPVQPRGFRLYMPFLSAQPPAAPTPTPSPTPSPTPTPDGGGGSTGIPCDAPGCALPDLIHPKSMAVSISKNLLYVVSRDNDRLLKVNPQTMQVMNTALTGDEPWGVVLNEATNLVYVGNFASADIWVYNADTLALVTKIRLGNPGETRPALMELLPSLNTVAVVLNGSNGVALIQGLTLTQIVGATGAGTYGIAVDVVNNRIFVSNRDAGNTRVIYRTEFGQWKNDGYNFTYSDRRVLFELAYNPNNKRLYSVYVINTDWFVDTSYERSDGSWGLLATTPVGRGGGARDEDVGGTGLVVNLVTGHVFNTNSADNTVTVLNANGQVLATVGTGVDPFTAVVNPATNVVFVGMRDARNTVNPDTVQKIIDNY